MTAPRFRQVDAHTGTIVSLTTERDDAVKRADDAEARRVACGIEVGHLSTYLKHMIAEKDDFRDMYLEYRDRYEGAQCRMDEQACEIREQAAEIRTLQSDLAAAQVQRDTAIAQAGR